MKIRHIASGLQFPEGPVAMEDGSVLLVEIARGTLSRVTPDGRIHVVAQLGGGPNGAAIGPDGAVYVCNNGGFEWATEVDGCFRPVAQAQDYTGGRIERVNLATGKSERLFDAVDGIGLRGPNDIVFDAQGGFYFTDLGKARAHDMDHGGVFYAPAAGGVPSTIARPALTPNGVALSPDGRTLYYAETAGARLWAFDITAPGQVRKDPWPSPHGGRMLVASPGGHYQRFDSMAVDAFGNLHVATLIRGGISVVSPDGRRVHHVPLPDRMVTNLCFGGRDLRTVYVTLSGSGRLVAIDGWPTPGLRLNFNA
jgi:gluconolactonase